MAAWPATVIVRNLERAPVALERLARLSIGRECKLIDIHFSDLQALKQRPSLWHDRSRPKPHAYMNEAALGSRNVRVLFVVVRALLPMPQCFSPNGGMFGRAESSWHAVCCRTAPFSDGDGYGCGSATLAAARCLPGPLRSADARDAAADGVAARSRPTACATYAKANIRRAHRLDAQIRPRPCSANRGVSVRERERNRIHASFGCGRKRVRPSDDQD